jgi:hypothetical protein
MAHGSYENYEKESRNNKIVFFMVMVMAMADDDNDSDSQNDNDDDYGDDKRL